MSPDDFTVNGVCLSTILNQHVLWNESNHRKGSRAVLEGVNLSNLVINPEKDITDFFTVSSSVTGQHLIEIFQPKGPIVQRDLPLGIDLSEIVFKKCIMNNVNLRQIDFDRADFSGSSLRDAILADSSFKRANFRETDLLGANLCGSKCDHAIFTGSDLRSAWFRDTNLPFAHMTQVLADGTLFRGANGWKVDFTGSNMRHAIFLSGWFEKAVFRECNLQDTNFGDAKVDNADFSQADLRGSNITPDQLRITKSCKGVKLHNYEEVPTEMPRVFLSYAWKDRSVVAAVEFWLRRQGLEIYRDERNFFAGDSLINTIQQYIERSEIVVFFISRNSKGRPYPKLELELARVLELESGTAKRLIYFCLDDTVIDSIQKIKLSIPAYKMTFDEACNELWYAITRTRKPLKNVNLSRFKNAGVRWTDVKD